MADRSPLASPASTSRRFVRSRASVLVALVALVVGAGSAVVSPGEAQQALTAPQVAARVQRFYDQVSVIRMRFYQTYFIKLHNRYERSSGVVTFKKPGKMLWTYDAPNRKILVSDGTRIQLYEPGAPGTREPGQVVESAVADSELPQALSFLTGQGRLEEQYAFRLVDPRTQGFGGGQVLELRPRRTNPNYERLLLYVADGSRVVRVLVIGHDGNRNRFDFSAFDFAPATVRDADFDWHPPAGTRRINPGN